MRGEAGCAEHAVDAVGRGDFGFAVVGGEGVANAWRFELRESGAGLVLNMKLGRWFFGSNMMYMISSQCNPWVLSAVVGGGSVGEYAMCESVVNIPRVALNSLQNVMAPMMARAHADGGKPELRKMVARMDRYLLAGSVAFARGDCGVWADGRRRRSFMARHRMRRSFWRCCR